MMAFVVAHQRTTVLATAPRKSLVKKEARSHSRERHNVSWPLGVF